MELATILHVLRRWLWLIMLVVLVTAVTLFTRLSTAAPLYEAQVKVQLTVPQQEDVLLFDRYRSSNLRDEITVARNNFNEVLSSREVHFRTFERLDLSAEEADYSVEVRPLRDSDFIYVVVQAGTPQLAEEVANTHVSAAIEYYGEIRAKPVTASKESIQTQLRAAEAKLRQAEEEFSRFQSEYGLTSLPGEMESQARLLERLEAERDQRRLLGSPSQEIQSIERLLEELRIERERAFAQGSPEVVARLDERITDHEEQLAELRAGTSPTANVDAVIEERRAALEELRVLAPRYSILAEEVEQARAEHQLLLEKYTEATLKEQTVQAVSFIQVVEWGMAPTESTPTRTKILLALALLGSFGVSLMLAFFLEYLTSGKTQPEWARQ